MASMTLKIQQNLSYPTTSIIEDKIHVEKRSASGPDKKELRTNLNLCRVTIRTEWK